MADVFFSYWINMPLKRFACLQNNFFKHYIPFLFYSSVKRTNISIGSSVCFFLKFPIYIKWVNVCT